MTQLLDDKLRKFMVNTCKRLAGVHKIAGACVYGPRVWGYATKRSNVHVLMVLRDYRTRLKWLTTPMNGITIFILVVEQGIFEGDIRSGWLGDFMTEKITLPYEPLLNQEYLQHQEVRAKKRTILEFCENIISEHPELCHELLIKPEYFMFESMMRKARLFPPITFTLLNLLRGDLREVNIHSMMTGYLQALAKLAETRQIELLDGYVKMTERLIKAVRTRKPKLPPIVRSIQRALFLHVLSIMSKVTSSLMEDQKAFLKLHQTSDSGKLAFQLEAPERHIFMPTSLGPVSLSEKTDIRDFVRRITPSGLPPDFETERLGGVLNSVYLLKYKRNQEEEKVVVKRFKDWLGLKWFPLSLWALGTKNFAVLGQTRLEREYSMNQFLNSHGFPVPMILGVNHQERLIFEGFIEGENLVKTIKRILLSKKSVAEDDMLVSDVGRKVAEAHRLGVAFGDCKPENIIVAENGDSYFVDLEQATRDGSQVWDVAEFLYYSGHYALSIASPSPAEHLAEKFINGYLQAGGKATTIRSASSARYTKVFTIFTPPHILLAVSNICRKMGSKITSESG